MRADHPYGIGYWVRWPIFASLAWTLLAGVPISEAKRSPEAFYQAGRSCLERLNQSPALRKYRHRWENCIREFQALLDQAPKHPLAPRSMFYLGELYSGLYGYSSNPKDRSRSKDYYRELVAQFSESPVARTARMRLDSLGESATPTAVALVIDVRHWEYPDYTRFVLDMDREVSFREGESGNSTLVLTLDRSRLSPKAEKELSSLDTGLLKRFTVEQVEPATIRITIPRKDLAQSPRIIPLSNPDRLVIDLFSKAPTARTPSPDSAEDRSLKSSSSGSAYAQAILYEIKTIVIDPGHGGKDPGAIGRTGLTEKDIVLDIGLRLRTLLRERMGKTVLMTRDDDTFISLDDRTLIANSKNADILISIHVNSHPMRSTRGVEVYHLGQSSDRRAMAVAARENNVSLQSLDALDKSVRQILFDLGREYNHNQSQELAHFTRQSFKTVLEDRYDYTLVDHGVKRAPFYVLLNSNMPSILAEVSFISNSAEEKLLGQTRYRQAIAESLFHGIRNYLTGLRPAPN